jgi:general nucleoside transport system permease protein
MLTDALAAAPLILASSLRLAVPLIFACIAGLWSERSGVVDISLEGKMLAGAFASAVVAYQTDSAWLGLLAGIGASVALSLVHGFAVIDQRGNQIVSGAAINLIAAGLTALLGNAWYGEGGRTPELDSVASRFQPVVWPGVSAVENIPGLGPLYASLVSGHVILTYLALLVVPLTAFVLFRTRFGLRLRATGENPAAVDTAGISVRGIRYAGVTICGVLCGLAGTYLSVAQAASFLPSMTAGKGFIALAALVFAKWRPWPALFTCLLFGFLDAASIRLQGVVIPGVGEVPVQAIQALPYLLTVILLAGFVGRAIPPRASGIPYVKER